MVVRKLWKSYLRWFDRSFSRGWLDQVTFLTLTISGFIGVWYLVALSFPGERNFMRILELMMDPGAFIGSDKLEEHTFPIFFSWVIAISGAVLFSAMMITVIGNIVSNRIDEFKKGLLRYDFDNHILILGANSMLVNMLKEIAADSHLSKKKVVVLTENDTEKLQDSVAVKFPDYAKKLDVTFLYGLREQEETLKYVQADEAHSIYILGEDNEPDHDSKNIRCWRIIQRLCRGISYQIQCFMVVDRLSSFHVFQFSSNEGNSTLRLTVINSLENWAQRALIARVLDESRQYPSIIGESEEDFDKDVRFVVFGMTQMAYVMATTVAHIVHKPNFVEGQGANTKRTKICFVLPDIHQEMNFFKGHYESLFKLSHSTYMKYEKLDDDKWGWKEVHDEPDADYGDFLDVEWVFIDGSIEDVHVRKLLSDYAADKNEKLSIAICNHDSNSNVAASLYLPDTIYDKNVPIFVYQPDEGDILSFANGTGKYSNVYPFGMKSDCYDPLFKNRLSKAKKINYLYDLQNNGKPYLAMGSQKEIETLWNNITSYVLMYSNIYAAASIPVKLGLMQRNLSVSGCCPAFTEDEVETLARIEHNRWNMEKLLMGFSALTIKQRNAMMKLKKGEPLTDDDLKQLSAALSPNSLPHELDHGAINKDLKTKLFKHKDITPYNDLMEDSRDYDRAIVRNIVDVEMEG